MSDREMIHDYLKSLMNFLSRLDKEDADDVLREIECHIYDVMEIREENGQMIDAATILEGFGQPRELASQYVDHILKGSPPPRGFKAIQKVKRGATKGLGLATGFFGYILATALIAIGLYKLFDPDAVGFWASESGESVVIGALSEVPAGTRELLGWWITPVAIGLGIVAAYLTSRLLRIVKLKS
ncbi:HAAS signaling domain-containing protein [Parasphingorhabdus sp.]|uniref:HAAS signaling domain-containing protein n=1 Tax=Parasphingorhabdus sp. TaxID=2709688 RepID=UPI003A8CF85F